MISAISGKIRKLRMVRRLMLHHRKTHEVSARRQLTEMLYLWARNGIGPLEYYLLGLFRPGVPWCEKLNTVSGAWYWKQVEWINPLELRLFATNKIATCLMLRSSRIPSPRIHGVLDGANGLTIDGTPLRDAADLRGLVESRSLTGVCLKPISGWSGRGVMSVVFDRDGDTIRARVQPSGPSLTLDQFWGEYHDRSDITLKQSRVDMIARYNHANRYFSTRIPKTNGWTTDRGRIFMTYGEPDRTVEKLVPTIGSPESSALSVPNPYVVWFYDQIEEGKQVVFEDDEGFDDFRLVHSNFEEEIFSKHWDQVLKTGLLEIDN